MSVDEFCELLCVNNNDTVIAIAEETGFWWAPVIGAMLLSEVLPFLGSPSRANGLLHGIYSVVFRRG